MLKILPLVLVIVLCNAATAQVVTKTYTGNGTATDTKPNVILKLKNDNTYDLQVFNDNYFTWQFYNGDYSVKADTLLLSYQQLYQVPTCRLIDTIGRERTVNFLYVDANDKVIDTFSVEFAGDTITIDHFPLEYKSMENDNTNKSNIKYTWYVPNFQGQQMTIKFYKPGRKTKDTFLVHLLMNNGMLQVEDSFKYLFAPFDKLKQQ